MEHTTGGPTADWINRFGEPVPADLSDLNYWAEGTREYWRAQYLALAGRVLRNEFQYGAIIAPRIIK